MGWQIGAEQSVDIKTLSRQMDTFYSTIANYTDFAEPNFKPEYWEPVKQAIRQCIVLKGVCRVLEFGAGKTSFGAFVSDIRDQIIYHVQDITATNEDYLTTFADKVIIGEITEIEDTYDIVFSTFTWEHLSRPEVTLKYLLTLLTSQGKLYLASPRYDFSFYIPPSVRHLPKAQQIKFAFWLSGRRVRAILQRKPDFLINLDPACLNVPWFRDADAVHLVSYYDLCYSLPDNYRIRRLELPSQGLKGWLWKRLCILFVEIENL